MSPTIDPPSAVGPETLLESLRSRYAVKAFDPEARIPPPAWDALQEALVLSPSSYGLQPWKFFVVEDPALRLRLQGASWNQRQIVEADKLVVLAVKADYGAADVERFVDRVAEVRAVPRAALEGYRAMMLAAAGKPKAEVDAWNRRQVYLALGTLLTSAAVLGVDACPMEGFDAAQYDELLGLPAKGYHAVVVAALGYRSSSDASARLPKVRFPRNEVVEAL